jgi:hypothetical protein
MATIGHPQVRQGKFTEKGLVTSGNELAKLGRFLPTGGHLTYTARDVIEAIQSRSSD